MCNSFCQHHNNDQYRFIANLLLAILFTPSPPIVQTHTILNIAIMSLLYDHCQSCICGDVKMSNLTIFYFLRNHFDDGMRIKCVMMLACLATSWVLRIGRLHAGSFCCCFAYIKMFVEVCGLMAKLCLSQSMYIYSIV